MNRPPDPSASLHRTAAFALAAACMLVPANLVPIVHTEIGGDFRTDTIWTGITELYAKGLWPLALIVFIASLVIPFLKLAGLGVLVISAHRGVPPGRLPALTRLHAFLDVIGRWSMLDVFLVSILTGLVRFGAPAGESPRLGIAAFAAAVAFTILATRAFDPRMLWMPGRPNPPA